MNPMNLKPMRPGGYYPHQLGLDDEYSGLRQAAIRLLVVLARQMKRCLAGASEGDKFAGYIASCVTDVELAALSLDDTGADSDRSEMFDDLQQALIDAMTLLRVLRKMDRDA